ncbi:hypothetical protein [Burkholderia cenocepacia]|uniref:hypothetical protein n=1 Tax=Burkholderia cenocepacia TaxID=95486 RepID=UPI000F57DE8A|nr:hypothetical protein [Burkholderia cenocepacia]
MVKIAKNDILGARASNAGDRFHELWALRKALALLQPGSPYEAITVEGIPDTDLQHSRESWTAMDVCLMSGGRSLGNARAALTEQPWRRNANLSRRGTDYQPHAATQSLLPERVYL